MLVRLGLLTVLAWLLVTGAMAATVHTIPAWHVARTHCRLGVHTHWETRAGRVLPRIFYSATLVQYGGNEGSEGVAIYRRGLHRGEVREWPGVQESTNTSPNGGPLVLRYHCRRSLR